MAGYISPSHHASKEALILWLKQYIHMTGGNAKAAGKAGIDSHDLAAILRLDRSVSLSKITDIGEALGLKLVMKWEK